MEMPSWLSWVALIAGILYILSMWVGALDFMGKIHAVGLLLLIMGLGAVMGGK